MKVEIDSGGEGAQEWSEAASAQAGAAPAVDGGHLLLQQLANYRTRIPSAILGNLANVAVIVYVFNRDHERVWITAWAALVVGLTLARGLLWHFSRLTAHWRPSTVHRMALINASVFATLWAVLIATLMGTGSPAEVAVLGIISAGLMSGGVFIYVTLPKAARIYMVCIVVGSGIGFMRLESATSPALLFLLAAFTAVLLRSLNSSFADFRARIEREHELQDAAETVKLLLNDYQDQGSDWLWQVDHNGRLENISPRFAQAVGCSAAALMGRHVLTLFLPSPELEQLRQHVTQGTSFRDLVLSLELQGQPHWWSLSARSLGEVEPGGGHRMRGVATDVTTARRAEAQVSYMAHYDSLTDLPNRFQFRQRLQRALNRRAEDEALAVLCLDLDHFKSINDTLGHPIGDQLLQWVALRLKGCLREHETVARLGGDEFAVLLTGLRSRDAARAMAERIIKQLAEPVDLGEHQVMTGASIGIAMAPNDGSTVEDLLRHADLALYGAKGEGRGRYAFFVPDMHEAAQLRREIENDLRLALTRDELSLHYQPLVHAETGETSGYEALVRWRHPVRGNVMPLEFIPIAEETGLIIQLGEWVLRRAVRDVRSWPQHLTVSVNLSPLQLRNSGLPQLVEDTLREHGVPGHRLEFEITETVLMQETEANLKILHQLRTLGVRIALDDFGTGYSSLNYLRSFPFDKIKIDRCFVRNIDSSEGSQAIVRAITGLATSLGMKTTAEGVERVEELEQLRQDGCVEVQGFLFSEAKAVEHLPESQELPGRSVRRPLSHLPEPAEELQD